VDNRVVDNRVKIDRFRDSPTCRVLVFTSPRAGSGRQREQIPRLVEQLQSQAIECEVADRIDELQHFVKRPGGQPIVVAAGGDGTISLAASTVTTAYQGVDSNQVAAGGHGRQNPVTETLPFGIRPLVVPMPLGTENLLARHFGQSVRAEAVMRTIRHGVRYELDTGTANDVPFLIMASCGFDAEVVRGLHLRRKGHIGRLSYLNPILRAIRRYSFPRIRVRVDDREPFECGWAMVFNLPAYGGGLRIEPDAIGDDGLLDVIAFRQGSVVSGLRYASTVFLRTHLRSKDVIRYRGKTIEIDGAGRIPFQVDGDYGGKLPLKVRVRPRYLNLLVPDQNQRVVANTA